MEGKEIMHPNLIKLDNFINLSLSTRRCTYDTLSMMSGVAAIKKAILFADF